MPHNLNTKILSSYIHFLQLHHHWQYNLNASQHIHCIYMQINTRGRKQRWSGESGWTIHWYKSVQKLNLPDIPSRELKHGKTSLTTEQEVRGGEGICRDALTTLITPRGRLISNSSISVPFYSNNLYIYCFKEQQKFYSPPERYNIRFDVLSKGPSSGYSALPSNLIVSCRQ